MLAESVYPLFDPWHSLPLETLRVWNSRLRCWMGDEAGAGTGPQREDSAWSPLMDVYETSEGMEFHFDLPGVDPAKVEIGALANTLVIRGHRERSVKIESAVSVVQESRCGPFVREVGLPCNLDGPRAKATYEHGVLVIAVPKRDEAKARTIPIQTN